MAKLCAGTTSKYFVSPHPNPEPQGPLQLLRYINRLRRKNASYCTIPAVPRDTHTPSEAVREAANPNFRLDSRCDARSAGLRHRSCSGVGRVRRELRGPGDVAGAGASDSGLGGGGWFWGMRSPVTWGFWRCVGFDGFWGLEGLEGLDAWMAMGLGLDLSVEARTMGCGMLGIPVSHSACDVRYWVLRPPGHWEPDEQDGLQEHRHRLDKTDNSPLLDARQSRNPIPLSSLQSSTIPFPSLLGRATSTHKHTSRKGAPKTSETPPQPPSRKTHTHLPRRIALLHPHWPLPEPSRFPK